MLCYHICYSYSDLWWVQTIKKTQHILINNVNMAVIMPIAFYVHFNIMYDTSEGLWMWILTELW